MKVASLDQFLCDYFLDGDYVEINANFLQRKLIDLIKNERLATSQMYYYKIKYDRAMLKIEALECEKMLSDVKYRIDEKV